MKKIFKNKMYIGIICAFCSEVIFGISYLFTKQAMYVSSELTLLAWRFFIAFLLINIFVLLKIVKINFKNKHVIRILILTLFNPILYFIGETLGVKYTTASESGVFLASIPVVCVLMSSFLLGKKPNKNQIAGICLTLFGVLITIISVGVEAKFSLGGYAMLLLAVISHGLYSIKVEHDTEFTSGEMTYLVFGSGALFFGLFACREGIINNKLMEIIRLPFENRTFLTAVLYQGICCSSIGFLLYNVAISKIGVNKTSTFVGISSVISIIAGAAILKESFTLVQIFGVVQIILGVYIANADLKKENTNLTIEKLNN